MTALVQYSATEKTMAPDTHSPNPAAAQAQPSEQKLTRPNLALDPATQAVTFRTAGERALYMQDLINQGVVPKHYTSVAQLENAYKILNQLGLPWELHLNKLYYVGAQLTIMVEPVLTACKATGLMEFWVPEFIDKDNVTQTKANLIGFQTAGCVCTGKRRDETREVMRAFTLDRAKTAGLTGRNQNYAKFTDDMLYWRAAARALKTLFPEICGGLAIQGLDDFEPMQDEQGKQLLTEGGQPIYQARQARMRGRIDMLTGGK